MSQAGSLNRAIIPPGTGVEYLTGNSGGATGPDGLNNINIVGSGVISVVANPATHTLTISASGEGTTITGDSGGALSPTAGNWTFTGGTTGLTFAGVGSTETLGGTLAIANGGTNATSMTTTDGVVYFDGTSLVTTAVGTSTYVLTSNGAGNAPTFQSPGGGSAGTITGNDAVPEAQVGGNWNIVTSNATVTFAGSAGTETLNLAGDANNNFICGVGSFPGSGLGNIGVGYNCFNSYGAGTGSYNIGLGFDTLNNISTSESYNVAIGYQALENVFGTPGFAPDIAIGYHAGKGIGATGGNNVCIGTAAMGNGFNSSAANIVIGSQAGFNYANAESSNILLNNTGIAFESNTLHIGAGTGTGSQQLAASYISGIDGVALTTANVVTEVGDQLGTAVITGGTNVTIDTTTPNQIIINASGGGGSGITTINGNTGSVTGDPVTIETTNSTIIFDSTSGTTSVLNMAGDANDNFICAVNTGGGFHSTPGSNNIAIGHNALEELQAGSIPKTGSDNIALGYNALSSIETSDSFNIGIGSNAMGNCSGAPVPDIGIGYQAGGVLVSSGGGNVFIGSQAVGVGGGTNSTNCIAMGLLAGSNWNASEAQNICINSPGVAGESNALHIGVGTGTGSQELSQAFISGIQGITVIGAAVLVSSSDQLGIAVSSAKFKDNIQDMGVASEALYNLRPTTFTYKGSTETHYGLIAEEVDEVMPNLVVYDKSGDPQTVMYHELPALLLNEIQKLRKEVDKLKKGK